RVRARFAATLLGSMFKRCPPATAVCGKHTTPLRDTAMRVTAGVKRESGGARWGQQRRAPSLESLSQETDRLCGPCTAEVQPLTRVTSCGLSQLLRLRDRARADCIGGAMADESSAGGGPFLLRLRHDGLAARVEHEQTGRSLEQTGAAADAAVALDVDDHAP